jgi:hypothetical protein
VSVAVKGPSAGGKSYTAERVLALFPPAVLSVLAFFPGFILIVPPFVAIYRLGTRVARMEGAAGIPSRASGGVGVLLAVGFRLQSLPAVLPKPSQ